MTNVTSGISKYQEFAAQASKQRVELINKTNLNMNTLSPGIEIPAIKGSLSKNTSPVKPPTEDGHSPYINTPHLSKRQNRMNRSIEVTSSQKRGSLPAIN